MYSGTIKSYSVKKKQKVDIKSFALWFVGIVISFLPIFVDMLIFYGENECFTKAYGIELCLKGDVLWILATIIVLTIVDYISSEKKSQKTCAVFGTILWGVVFAVWVIFKYIYKEDYTGDFPLFITLILAGLALSCCTPLQIKMKEVKG